MSLSRSSTIRSVQQPARLQRDPSQEEKAQKIIAEVLEELKAATKRAEKPNKAYVCHADIRRIWRKKSRINDLIRASKPSDAQAEFIQNHMIVILSTLVWIGASHCLNTFRSRFFRPIPSCEALFVDTDIPCFDRGKLKFLDSEPAIQEQFYEHQFRFKPVEIRIKNSQTTQKINPKQRLPFERREKGVGAGGYGQVDRVDISPRYIYQQDVNQTNASPRWDSKEIYIVACKKINLPKDFDQEKDNLQVLKESLTSHIRIMKHLTTIEHGPTRYILLPFAAYGDLEVFLHCGMAPDGTKKYDFNKFFKGAETANITFPLISECWSLANALEWLHNQIKIERSSETVFCAHMDLKPANILIQPDDESEFPLGKWVISDFGISVFKEETQRQDSDYGSIGDYYSKLTMNTRPKRQEGTYQAPEVKRSEKAFNQASQLSADQKGIGRKSDIWSFGCILAEVLAFSMGRAQLVREFSEARRNDQDNYFYSEKDLPAPQFLSPADRLKLLPREYEVRPSVISWLDGLCVRVASPQRWIDCYVGTIKKILVVDPNTRPNAIQLLELLRHVKEHVRHSRDSQKVDCSVLEPKPPKAEETTLLKQITPPPTPPPPASVPKRAKSSPVSPRPTASRADFMMFRSTTFETKEIHAEGPDDDDSHDEIDAHEGDDSDSIPGSDLPSINVDPLSPSRLSEKQQAMEDDQVDRPGPHPVQKSISGPDPPNAMPLDHKASLFTSFARPLQAHGILIDRIPGPEPKPTRTSLMPPTGLKGFNSISMSVTITTSGARLACLSKEKSVVFLYDLGSEALSATFDKEIKLPNQNGWSHVSISGDFLVVWGYTSSKIFHFCDIRDPNKTRPLSSQEIGMLDKAAVSARGVAALLCRGTIKTIGLNNSAPVHLEAAKDLGQNFTHAAFNDTGDLLFAWAYGQKDTLYCWRCQGGVMNKVTESQSTYQTVKVGDPDLTRVIPYSRYQGCIIERQDRRFFPAQIHSTLRERRETLPCNNEVKLSNLRAACVFNDHSLVTIEKGTVHHYLVEYKIDYRSTHLISQPGIKICRLKSSVHASSQLVAVKQGDSVVIFIANMNGTVEFVKVLPG